MVMLMLFGDVVQCLIECSIDSSMILCIKMMMCCLHTMSGIDVIMHLSKLRCVVYVTVHSCVSRSILSNLRYNG